MTTLHRRPMRLVRTLLAAAALATAGSALADATYVLPLPPTSPFTASVDGVFIDDYTFDPASFTGHLDVSFLALTPTVNFFVGTLDGQSFSFFPENGLSTFDFGLDVDAGTPLSLSIFGAVLDDGGSPIEGGRYQLTVRTRAAGQVPEPAPVMLLLAGFAGLTLLGRRRVPAAMRTG